MAYDSILVKEYCDESVAYIPNSFSPNEDNVNDKFFIYGTNLSSIEIFLFNRWGEKIYSSKNLQEGWDGTYMGNKAQEDIYIWQINYKTKENNSEKTLRGNFVLIR